MHRNIEVLIFMVVPTVHCMGVYYNINLGKNQKLLDSCIPLKGYSTFIDRVRKNLRNMPIEEGVDEALRYCIAKDILKDVLEEERSGVMLEMLTEFDEKLYEDSLREEGWEKGLEEGIEKGKEEERKNTESERQRADNAERELNKLLAWAKEHGYKS